MFVSVACFLVSVHHLQAFEHLSKNLNLKPFGKENTAPKRFLGNLNILNAEGKTNETKEFLPDFSDKEMQEEDDFFTPNSTTANHNVTFHGNSTLFIKKKKLPLFDLSVRSMGRRLGDEKKYLISKTKASWLRAVQQCRNKDMQLAVITSRRDQRLIRNDIKRAGIKQPVWTSGSDLGKGDRYQWLSNGEPLRFDRWRKGQPDNLDRGKEGVDHCLQVSPEDDFEWSDFSCFTKQHFACQYLVM